jgi:splicing factor U2AF subunit
MALDGIMFRRPTDYNPSLAAALGPSQPNSNLNLAAVCLTQVVSADELRDDEEYVDIVEDMREEGRKYGILHETLDFCPLFFKLLYSVSY